MGPVGRRQRQLRQSLGRRRQLGRQLRRWCRRLRWRRGGRGGTGQQRRLGCPLCRGRIRRLPWRRRLPPLAWRSAREMGLEDQPLLLAAVTLVLLAAAAALGQGLAGGRLELQAAEREDFGLVLGATLTLLAPIIGFSFSMALNRYDQRKGYEEDEANAIGTAFLRAELLGPTEAARVRTLLRGYTRERIAFYTSTELAQVDAINARTAALQNELWKVTRSAVAGNPNPVSALVVSGMNDVLNSQGYTQAAWWNRIPRPAWMLMIFIAVCATFLVGYGSKNTRAERGLLLVLPVIVSVAFLLIADIESPRSGSI